MARRVADDELAAFGGEVAVGHVDGDALLAFGRQAVGQQRQVGLAALGDAGQLVLQHGARVHQKSADQRALAVIDGAAGDEAQGRGVGGGLLCGLAGLGGRGIRDGCVGGNACGGHQKYPSFLRFSMEASLVLSSMRVAPRSLTSAARVSSTMSAAVAASLSTGQVQVMSPTVRKRTSRTTTCSPSRGGVSSVTGTSRPRRSTTSRLCV